MKICKNNKLIRGILNSSEKPKITALITVYNSQKYIFTAIKSIQNQKFSDIEILIIDDGSTDDSLTIIKNLQKEDKRIKIIENKKNRGALYSKSIGILKSSGKYTMILDSDDLFANENIFDICFNEAKQKDIDIIEFSGFKLNNEYFRLNKIPKIPFYLRFKHHNEYVQQPDLSLFLYKRLGKNNYQLIDGFLWGKCIKSAIFKMSVKMVGSDIYFKKINYGDDRIINFILFKLARTFKYINEYGIIYRYNKKSITHRKININNCHDELVNIMSIYNYTKNTREIEVAAFEIVHRWNNILLKGLNLNNSQNLLFLINELLLNSYIRMQTKAKLISMLNKLTKSKYKKYLNIHHNGSIYQFRK